MAGPNDILTKTFIAGAAIGGNKLVKMGSADGAVIEAVDGAAAIIGVAPAAGAASGARVDIQIMGIAEVKSGGSISRGGYVTASTAGVGVASAPGAGVNSNVAGIAMVDAASGDVFPVLLAPSRIQG